MGRRSQPSRPSHAFYHATTASARAAAQLARRSAPPSQLRADAYHARPERPAARLPPSRAAPPSPPPPPPPPPPPARRVQVLVEKRLIRGSAVFRPPTERDIDELLRLEASRRTQRCLSAAVDVPPAAPAFRKRSSSLLPPPHLLRVADLAALDDCTALAICLRHIRAHRSNMHTAATRPALRNRLPLAVQQRSLSAADTPSPVLPPSPAHQILLSALANPLKPLPLLNSSRSRSEILPHPPLSSHHRPTSPAAPTAPSSLTNPTVCQPRLHFKRSQNDDDDDTLLPIPLRILTAIEPVDPAAALIDAQLRRTSSCHASSTTFDLPLFRRRRPTSTLPQNDTGFLNRLHRRRSFRRRPDTWPSILRRFSSHRHAQPA